MFRFILNNEDISTDLPPGMTVLDFVRYRQNLKGTKIGCREGDCGACAILVGELVDGLAKYRTMTSCLMPLANAAGKHIVSIEGINPSDGSLTPVQQALVDESGTQCGFCTVGFVMSLTGFCIDETDKTREMAVSSVDGNICRCTGYKSIERAAATVRQTIERRQRDRQTSSPTESGESNPRGIEDYLKLALARKIVPEYFAGVADRLSKLKPNRSPLTAHGLRSVAGGTDVYVQRPDALVETESEHVFYDADLRGIRDTGEFIEIGASVTVTDLLVSPVIRSIFPDLYKHLKLVSSTPIRNMATLAGNFVNASPIGDMTVWFLALDSEIVLGTTGGDATVRERAAEADDHTKRDSRIISLKDIYLGYKQLAKSDDEIITAIRFRKPSDGFRFNFEKVCKRTYLDIATVNTAISLKVSSPLPGASVIPELLRGRLSKDAFSEEETKTDNLFSDVVYGIEEAHVAAGGVAPIPLYLKETSKFLTGREVNAETVAEACEIIQTEISPISDVRGTAEYKRLLLQQLFKAHFVELFNLDPNAS